jgi:hypothetical protein
VARWPSSARRRLAGRRRLESPQHSSAGWRRIGSGVRHVRMC